MGNYKVHKSAIKTIKPNEAQFIITDGIVQAPRAGFEISNRCPSEYKKILQECISYGWIMPVANMTEREMMISGLIQE